MKTKLIFATFSILVGSTSCEKSTKEQLQESTRMTRPDPSTEKGREIFIASGGGYRKPVNELKAAFEAEHHIVVNCIFGNMKQITTQVKRSGKVSVVIGDAKFLKKANIDFKKRGIIGKGKLVLAFDKSLDVLKVEDIEKPDIDRIILPDAKKAIYGRASNETLKNMSLFDKVKEKLIVVQTVPQVTSYLVSGTAKAGFINKTDALALDRNKFSFIEVAPVHYEPITIVAALTDKATEAGNSFFSFVQTETARAVFAKYGLGMGIE